ncbi:MAG: hypothetical protein WAN16_06990 [Chthoniobacterales bacterium]
MKHEIIPVIIRYMAEREINPQKDLANMMSPLLKAGGQQKAGCGGGFHHWPLFPDQCLERRFT